MIMLGANVVCVDYIIQTDNAINNCNLNHNIHLRKSYYKN